MSAALKYADKIADIGNCPPAPLASSSRLAYRLVFASAQHPHNYLPPAEIRPSRKWNSDEEFCEGYALSLFISAEALVTAMLALEASFKQLRKRLGDRITEGNIEPSDGLMDEPGASGHFNLHEYAGCDLAAKFAYVAALPP